MHIHSHVMVLRPMVTRPIELHLFHDKTLKIHYYVNIRYVSIIINGPFSVKSALLFSAEDSSRTADEVEENSLLVSVAFIFGKL